MKEQLYTTLANGVRMPLLGLGVYDMYQNEAEEAVSIALETGYRLIDTAAMYRNEREIGNAVRRSGVPRQEIFITTKVANGDQGYDATLRAFEESERKLHLEYIDLYLVHWPIRGKRKDTWKALEHLYREKAVRAIGVANYPIPILEELKTYSDILPVVNQVEFSPYLYLRDLLKYCEQNKILLQAYCPLVRGKKMKDPRLVSLAGKYKKTPAQILLRWDLEHGVSPIPKSSRKERLKENFDLFDFEISGDDVKLMDGFNENFRIVEDPMDFL